MSGHLAIKTMSYLMHMRIRHRRSSKISWLNAYGLPPVATCCYFRIIRTLFLFWSLFLILFTFELPQSNMNEYNFESPLKP